MENQTDQNLNPTQPVSPVVQVPPVSSPINPPSGEPKSKFPLALIVGIILFLLVVGSTVGFYIFKQQSSKIVVKPIVSLAPTISQTQTPSPTPNPKIYTNAQDGFSFENPDTYKLTDLNSNTKTSDLLLDFAYNDGSHLTLSVQNSNWQTNLDYLATIAQGKAGSGYTNIRPINLAGSTIYSYIPPQQVGLGSPQFMAEGLINNKYYTFNFFTTDTTKHEGALNQILSTFKFTQ